MFSALMIVTIAINTVPSAYSTSCCPKCSIESIDPFNDDQLQQIVSQRSAIEAIEQDPQLLHNSSYQRSFVTLNPRQNKQILRNFPEIFRDQESFQNSTGDGSRRRRRSTDLSQVCPPQFGSQPLVIARIPSGEVIELVQMQDMNQWILEETCRFDTDPTSPELSCCLVDRHVVGLFINLSRKSKRLSGRDFDYADIVVQSCVTFR